MMKKLKQVKSVTEQVNWRVEGGLRWVGVCCPTFPPLLLPLHPDTEKKHYAAAAGLPLNRGDSLPNFKLPSC